MAGYPTDPLGDWLPPIGWTGTSMNPAAPAGGNGTGYSQPYAVEKAEEVWDWMKATGDQAMNAVSERALRSYEAHVDELGRRVFGATTWSEIYTAAKLILGPNCYYFGVACGAAANLASMVGDLLGLWKMFVLAGMYELSGTDRPRNAYALMNPLTAALELEGKLLRHFLGKEMKEADEKVRALMDQLGKIMRDPVKFLGATWASTKKEYLDKWNRHLQLLKDGGLTSQFEAGKLAGEVFAQVVLTVLALISGAGLAVRGAEVTVGAVRAVGAAGEQLLALSREAPGVMKIAQGLEEEGVARAGGVAREAEAGEETGARVNKAKPKVEADSASKAETGEPLKRPSYVLGASDGGPGVWAKSPKYPTDPADAAFQQAATGAPAGVEYKVPTSQMASGVKYFDGFDPNTGNLIDAKNYIDWPKTDLPFSMTSTTNDLISSDSIASENGTISEIRVASQDKADLLQSIVDRNGLTNTIVRYWSPAR